MNRSGVRITYAQLKKIKESKFIARSVGFNQKMTQIRGIMKDRKTKTAYVAHSEGIKQLKRIGEFDHKNYINDGIPVEISPDDPLSMRQHQVLVLEWLMENIFTQEKIDEGSASTNMELKTGLGKTFVGMGLFRHFAVKSLFIIPANLIPQWEAAFEEWLPSVRVGVFTGKKKVDGDVILGSPSALMASKIKIRASMKRGAKKFEYTPSEFFAQFGLTVIDEIQDLCTNKKAKLFTKARSLRTLAMSGTCNHRLDKMDKIAHLYLGPVQNMIDLIPEIGDLVDMSSIDVDAYKVMYNGPDEYTEPLTTELGVSHPLMINQFTKDPYRNELIVQKAKWCVEQGHSTFIFLDRIGLIDSLIPIIKERLGDIAIDAPESKVFCVQGKTTQEDRDFAKEKGMLTLITYGCGSKGLSYDRYTAIIFAHPRRNKFLQSNNRIFRLDTPKEKGRVLMYIVDQRTSSGKQYSGFKKALKQEYPQTVYHNETYNWEDIKID